eukprot:5951669-Pleurochrysis_carterae.AAC.1
MDQNISSLLCQLPEMQLRSDYPHPRSPLALFWQTRCLAHVHTSLSLPFTHACARRLYAAASMRARAYAQERERKSKT